MKVRVPRNTWWRTAIAIAAIALASSSGATAAGDTALTLDQIVAAARTSTRVKIARAATAKARAQRDEASGHRYPSIRATGYVAPSPDITCADEDCVRTTNRDATVGLAGVAGRFDLSITQPLYTFGKLSAVTTAAAAAVDAAQWQERSAADVSEVDAVRAYYGVLLARELRWMLLDGRDEVAKALTKVNAKIDAGAPDVTLQDRYRIELLAAEVDARLTEAAQAEAQALAGVRALVGRDDATVVEVQLEPVEATVGDEQSYVDAAVTSRPEVKAAQAGVRARTSMIDFERSAALPDVVLVGGARVARAQGVDDPPSAFANDPYNTTSAALALAIRWTFDPAVHGARMRRARAERQHARAVAEGAQVVATMDARNAHAVAVQTKARLEAATRAQKTAKAWLASALQADAIGTLDAKDLADAYLAFFTARARLLQTIYDWNVAIAVLRRASGESPKR